MSGLLLCIGGAQEFGTQWRLPLMTTAVIAFLAGAVVQVLNKIDTKIDEHNHEMLKKIEDSVGDVWESGERAGVRHQILKQAERHAPLVRSESRLAIVPDRGSC